MSLAGSRIPTLARGVRLRRRQDGTSVLLVPEGVLDLTQAAAATLELIDATRSISDIARMLAQRYEGDHAKIKHDVAVLLERLAARNLVDFVEAPRP